MENEVCGQQGHHRTEPEWQSCSQNEQQIEDKRAEYSAQAIQGICSSGHTAHFVLVRLFCNLGGEQRLDEGIPRHQQNDAHPGKQQAGHERQQDESDQCHDLSGNHHRVLLSILEAADEAALDSSVENAADYKEDAHLCRGDVDLLYAEQLECTFHPAHRQYDEECGDEKDADRFEEVLAWQSDVFPGADAWTIRLLNFEEAEYQCAHNDDSRHVVGKAQADLGKQSAHSRSENESEADGHADQSHETRSLFTRRQVRHHAGRCCIEGS